MLLTDVQTHVHTINEVESLNALKLMCCRNVQERCTSCTDDVMAEIHRYSSCAPQKYSCREGCVYLVGGRQTFGKLVVMTEDLCGIQRADLQIHTLVNKLLN